MNKVIKVTKIIKITGCCPTQWEGVTDDGLPIYIRYRHGDISVRVDDEEIFYGDPHPEAPGSGFMKYPELKMLLGSIVELPGDEINVELEMRGEWSRNTAKKKANC